jgi:Caspase domain
MAGTRSALIVATDEYVDAKLRELRTPADDAAALARVLADPEIGEFDVELCMNPMEHELRRTLSRFFADRRPDDVLLLHFGCHGVKDDDGHLYFAAADTDIAHLDATAVPAEFVNRRMNDSRSKRIMLFLDCCYSGAFAAGMTARAGEKVEVKERFEGSGRVVLTASNAMEYSFEGDDRTGEGRRSVFTAALVRGLETGEADRDQDHWISIDELYDYVFERVRDHTPNQTPGKWSYVQGDVLVARSSWMAPVEPEELPADVSAMLDGELASMKVAIVPELERMVAARRQYEAAARRALERLRDDDSRRVAAAADDALSRLEAPAPAVAAPAPAVAAPTPTIEAPVPTVEAPPPAAEPAPPPPPPVAEPAPPTPARRAWLDSWPMIVVAAGVLSMAGGAVAGELFWVTDLRLVVGWIASGVLLAGPVALVAVLAGRSAWPVARAVTAACVIAAALSAPVALIDDSEAQVVQWVLFGAACGLAALIPTGSRTAIAAGVGLGAASALACGLVATNVVVIKQINVIVLYFALPAAVIGAAIAVAIARAPRVTKPGA